MINNNEIISYKIEGQDTTQLISLSDVLTRVEEVYSTTEDKEFLLNLIAQDYVNTYNTEILNSITIQIYIHYLSSLTNTNTNTKETASDIAEAASDIAEVESDIAKTNTKEDEELISYTNRLFKFLKIEPIIKTNIHNIHDLYSYITNKVNSVKYSKFAQFLHPQDTFELLKRFYIHKRERVLTEKSINEIIVEKYNKINSEKANDITDISEPSNVLIQVRTTDMDILADRINSLIMTLQHYLKTLDFCKTNNINVPIVKIYNDIEDLQADNAKSDVPYDKAFDTRARDFRLIENIIREYSPQGNADDFDIEYIKELLQSKEIENIIKRVYYYELKKEDYKATPKELVNEDQNKKSEEKTEQNETDEPIQNGGDENEDNMRSIIDDFIQYYETREIPEVFIKEGDYCAVKNGPCNIYVRSEGDTWIPAETDTNMTIKNMDIKPSMLELIQNTLHFNMEPEERLFKFKEIGGFVIDKLTIIKILNYFQMNMKAPLLYYNVKFLFKQIEKYTNQSHIFKTNDTIGAEIEKYRTTLGKLAELYDTIELDFIEMEEESRKIDRTTQPKYQQDDG